MMKNTPFYYSTVVLFYRITARERAKYASVLHCTVPVWPVFLLKEDEAKTKCSGIINLLFVVLVDLICVDILLISRIFTTKPVNLSREFSTKTLTVKVYLNAGNRTKRRIQIRNAGSTTSS